MSKTRSQIGKMSKNKGKVGEREVVQLLKEHGFMEARRSQQFCGADGDADVLCESLNDHIEVKRTERCSPYKFYEQACDDAAINSTPIVYHRQSHKPWLVILGASDYLKMQRELVSLRDYVNSREC